MKILISNDSPNAHFYIRQGLCRALTYCGHDVVLWDIHKKNAYDMFDEFEPDIFWGQSYNLNESTVKCIEERPYINVILRAPDWGVKLVEIDRNKYPILVASDKDINYIRRLQKIGKPNFVHCHYTQESMEETHSCWSDMGVKVVSMLNAADVFLYTGGQRKKEYITDVAFVGGNWGYKSQVINEWLMKLVDPRNDYIINMKIFGNQHWHVPEYMGFAQDDEVRDIFSSALVCPNMSEPHSQAFGYDIVERPFKLLSNKCFVVSDYVEDLANLIPNGMIHCKTPEEFREKILYYVRNPEERQAYIDNGYEEVMSNHTYFHRARDMFNELGLKQEAKKVVSKYDELRKKLEN